MRTAGTCVCLKTNKDESLSTADRKILSRLAECHKSKTGIISFKEVFRTLAWLFHLNKRESWLFLKEMQEKGAIQIVPYRGVRLLVGVGKNEQNKHG